MKVQHLNAGEIIAAPIGNSNPIAIPHGLIHHWIGAVFVPGATIEDLAAVLNDYDKYNEIYRPTLISGTNQIRGRLAEVFDSVGVESSSGDRRVPHRTGLQLRRAE
jgi:hypothetical protein